MSLQFDNTKLKKELGWKIRYKLDETIADMIDYIKTR